MKFKKFISVILDCESSVFAVLLFFYFIGFVYGCFSESILSVQADNIYLTSFANILLQNLFVLISLFLLAYSAIAAPFICFVMVYWGVCNGLFCEAVCLNSGLKGVVALILCYFLQFFMYLIFFITLSYSSLKTSFALLQVFKNNTRYISPAEYSKPHIIKFVVFFILVCVLSAFDFYLLRPLLNFLL